MKRTRSFAMRMSTNERRSLTALAARLQRTKSDTVRLLVREAGEELVSDSRTNKQEAAGDDRNAN
ncbi:MAG: hypothetical protein QF745_08335 [Planctomycetota bacterium]|jgi:predicted DNA-binding protein|nr:hypothetical protein [Planctomycetota bacterium]